MKAKKDIHKLVTKVNKLHLLLKNDIYGICEQLEYKESSLFSYNIDRLEQFVNSINETSETVLINN